MIRLLIEPRGCGDIASDLACKLEFCIPRSNLGWEFFSIRLIRIIRTKENQNQLNHLSRGLTNANSLRERKQECMNRLISSQLQYVAYIYS